MKHILSVNPIAFINEDLKQGDHFMHSIFEKVCEVGAKSIVLMEEFYDVQPHLNLYKANELKKQISQYGLRADACWYYTDPLRAAYVSSRKEVIDQLREYVCNTAYMGAKYLLLPPGEPSPDRFRTWREAQDDLQDLYEHVIPICEENNVVLCMEAGRNLSPLSSPRGSLDKIKDTPIISVPVPTTFPYLGISSSFTFRLLYECIVLILPLMFVMPSTEINNPKINNIKLSMLSS